MSDNELTPSEVEADLQANLSRQTLQYRLRARISNGAGKTAREAADRIDALEAQVAAHENYWVKPWECPLCNQSVNNSGSSAYLHLVDHEYSEQAKIDALEAEVREHGARALMDAADAMRYPEGAPYEVWASGAGDWLRQRAASLTDGAAK